MDFRLKASLCIIVVIRIAFIKAALDERQDETLQRLITLRRMSWPLRLRGWHYRVRLYSRRPIKGGWPALKQPLAQRLVTICSRAWRPGILRPQWDLFCVFRYNCSAQVSLTSRIPRSRTSIVALVGLSEKVLTSECSPGEDVKTVAMSLANRTSAFLDAGQALAPCNA